MAKNKPGNAERRAMVEKMRAEQARKERLRSLAILGVCLLVVVGILGLAVGKYLSDGGDGSDKISLDKIGVPAPQAQCDPITTKAPTGKQRSGVDGNHVKIGTTITYPTSPPAFGQHWPNYLQASEYRNFYSPSDRPQLERMVHSLEHGHTLIWYDGTITPGSTEYQQLQKVADKYDGTTTYINVVPWLSTDGPAFPDGKHVVLTHWAGSGDHQQGIWEYCGKTSGQVIESFVKKYPNTDSPEAGAP
ncbi:DUF3105 domain-containing protein [Nocardioides marmorisolisilvae]|uniref:DUF3105 domain-containing protein n=1 Tax=Nocardioides marmorisolisilvae TaxID=1542737 RepID=A0A3N0DSM1_9ACTN|nr:DUF3105 domain-containing protein [Nocardioides marmorisolisilvae]RNL78628.1 DUF3105 domain-containing protein [Nocardioides marmorisolisilvae]